MMGLPSEVLSALRFLQSFELTNGQQPCIMNLSGKITKKLIQFKIQNLKGIKKCKLVFNYL